MTARLHQMTTMLLCSVLGGIESALDVEGEVSTYGGEDRPRERGSSIRLRRRGIRRPSELVHLMGRASVEYVSDWCICQVGEAMNVQSAEGNRCLGM